MADHFRSDQELVDFDLPGGRLVRVRQLPVLPVRALCRDLFLAILEVAELHDVVLVDREDVFVPVGIQAAVKLSDRAEIADEDFAAVPVFEVDLRFAGGQVTDEQGLADAAGGRHLDGRLGILQPVFGAVPCSWRLIGSAIRKSSMIRAFCWLAR